MRIAKDFSGKVIGRLTVLRRIDDKIGCYGQPIVQWECKCECGSIVVRRASHLYRGSCKCKQCKAIEDAKKFGYMEIRQHHWYTIKKQAEKRNLNFDISMKCAWDLYELQERKCALSGLPIGFGKTRTGHAKGDTTASLDRIDSSKGYIEGNIQWLHKWVNLMKSDFEEKEFIAYCKLIVEQYEKNNKDQTAFQMF